MKVFVVAVDDFNNIQDYKVLNRAWINQSYGTEHTDGIDREYGNIEIRGTVETDDLIDLYHVREAVRGALPLDIKGASFVCCQQQKKKKKESR